MKKVYLIYRNTGNTLMLHEIWSKKDLAKKRVDELNKPFYTNDMENEDDEWYELESHPIYEGIEDVEEDDEN